MAVTQILSQEAILTEDEAANLLRFKDWENSIQNPLLKLFSSFAVAKKYAPEEKTVGLGISVIITCNKKKTKLDNDKVNNVAGKAILAAEAKVDKNQVQETYQAILKRLSKLSIPLHAVSGKDFLLPLLDFHLQDFGCRIRRKSLRMRLATSGSVDRFTELSAAINSAALGHP